MTLLSWSSQYLIGNDLIDSEHEELFRLVNDFHSRWLEARQPHEIAKVLNRLIAYAEIHFRHEETVMAEAGFTALDAHRQEHEAMIDTIFALQKSYEEGSLRLEMETMKFVKSWLIEHILESDYRFRDYLASKKRAATTAGQ